MHDAVLKVGLLCRCMHGLLAFAMVVHEHERSSLRDSRAAARVSLTDVSVCIVASIRSICTLVRRICEYWTKALLASV